MSSHSDSSSSGVFQETNFGNINEFKDDFAAKRDAINKQFQEWQQKFQNEMNAFNMNFQKQILQSLQK